MTQEDSKPTRAEELGKKLIMEYLRKQLIESRLMTETFKIVVVGFGIAFVIVVMLLFVIRLFGWVEG